MNLKKLTTASMITLAITLSSTCFAITKEDLNIGGVYIGQPFSAVTAIYGKPVTTKEEGAPKMYFRHSFASNGTIFDVLTGGNYYTKVPSDVFCVVVSGNNGIATSKGIKVGSTLKDITNVYGTPNRTTQQGANKLLFYEIKDVINARAFWSWQLIFTIDQNNIIQNIMIRKYLFDETT